MSTNPLGMHAVIPSRLQVGQPFSLKLRILGEPYKVPVSAQWRSPKPGLKTPFNLNVERKIQFVDNTIPGWRGEVRVDAEHYEGPAAIAFDGTDCGIYGQDDRPIKTISGCRFTQPGFHFLRLIHEESGLEVLSNPVLVTEEAPAWQIAWGDPHTHTFFTDGIRCPEDIYHFARYEGFLDFCALTDHSEGLTDAQWLYFQAVTNAANDPGTFVTLVGQEWTNHVPENGAPGHRNIYTSADGMPILRCTDDKMRSLEQLWAELDSWDIPVRAFPHHSANVVMGTDWEQPWNPAYETAVEIYSIWGNSERSAKAGNPSPIQACKGEMDGRHVQDGLRLGRRMSFIGGGDTHDGRPGDAMHSVSYPENMASPWKQGFTAARVPQLSRQHVFDAIADGQTYATTASRIYLDVRQVDGKLAVQVASEDGIDSVDLVFNGDDIATHRVDALIFDEQVALPEIDSEDYLYVRVTTKQKNMAWCSPFYG